MINNQTEISKQPQVTLRGTLVGLGIGTLILLSNFQFGLQTGWVSMMSLPAALLAYSVFKVVDSYFQLNSPFTPQENVYVQSVAVAVATGPLAYGFIGIIPAIEKLLTPAEAGIINDLSDELSHGFQLIFQPFKPWWKLLIWGSGLAFFGVFFAIPLREEFIIKQKLKFPSGSATATLISVFHNFPLRNLENPSKNKDIDGAPNELSILREGEGEGELNNSNNTSNTSNISNNSISREEQRQIDHDIEYQFELNQLETHNSSISEYLLPIQENESYSRDIVLLLFTAMISSIYTLTSYFIPQIRIIPIFGNYLSSEYLINFTPSPAYIGQGIIMGFETTSGMLAGMIIGWCILSPLAKYKGWAPGETGNWKDGSEGWIMWISLSIMIADSIVALILMSYRSFSSFLIPKREIKLIPKDSINKINKKMQNNNHNESSNLLINSPHDTLNHNGSFDSLDSYSSTQNSDSQSNINLGESGMTLFTKELSIDSNNENSIDPMIPAIGLILCCPILVISIKIIFGSVIPPWILILTIPISLILSLIGVKSLGETDLNPVSGIGKLSQLLTALVIPSTRPGAVLINLIVGAISEATAQQAGDLMQDLKTGYLLHGSPQAQFLAQIFGSIWGVLIAAPMYRWYDKIYQIPGPLFKIPTAVIWIDCARLVNGHDLPDKVGTFVIIFGIIFSILSLIRGTIKEQSQYYKFSKWIPSGVAVGIGIYNTPSFTLARFLGGLISFYWIRKLKLNNSSSAKIQNGKVALIIFSSGLVLGEGLFSVINMLLTSFNVPHL